jgi:subtilase family serine protease
MLNQRSTRLFRPRPVTRFRAPKRTRLEPGCETLEYRQLLSTAAASTPNLSQIVAQRDIQVLPMAASGPSGYTPQQIQAAYGVNQIAFLGGKAAGNGAGETIAIVTAYNDPNISSDLAAFDQAYKLSAPSSLTVDNLGSSRTDPGWALETSLDVEWAHSIAPAAHIVLVEAASDNFDDLFNAVNYARNISTVSVVSMSWGATEFWGESSYDSLFTTPAGHIGETFVAASGDNGAWYGPMYPSVSPNVLAVGGTTLTLGAGNSYGSEAGWSYSTGGFSGLDSNWWSYEPEPSYQTATLQSVGLGYGVRTTPDVSFNADPNTGVAVYDSVSYGGQSGWLEVGGTSAATPAWAGLVAIANQGLATGGKGTLSGTQAQTDLYNLPSSDFHDVTTGYNGYGATPGYDLVTGLGSPKANLVIAGILAENAVSQASAPTQATSSTVTHNVHVRGTRQDLLASSSSQTQSGGSVSIAGLSTTALAGSTTSSGSLGAEALVVQATSSPAQSAAQPSVVASSVNQGSAAPVPSGQSLPIQSQNRSTSKSVDEVIAPSPHDEVAVPTPSPAVQPQAVPASEPTNEPVPEQMPMPTPEAPSVSPAPAPDEPLGESASSPLDQALAAVGLDQPAERLGLPSRPTGEPEQVDRAASDQSMPTLAGAAVIAVSGYRVLIGRADRIKRRPLPGRFK